MPFSRARRAWSDQRGFTLIEVLLVTLVIAMLAAIALPAFLGQTRRAHDAGAQAAVRAAHHALAVFHTQTGGYAASPADLVEIDPGLRNAHQLRVSGDGETYTVSAASTAQAGSFAISRTAGRGVVRDCSARGVGACRAVADTAGNYW